MSGQVVVNTAECSRSTLKGTPGCDFWEPSSHCPGCLGNGRRALLDTAIPVEPRSYYLSAMDQLDCWIEVET